MTDKELVSKINSAKNVRDVFPDLSKWQQQFKDYVKLIHPDICKVAGCTDAMTKLNKYKEELQDGVKHNDDAGVVSYTATEVHFTGDKELLKTSFDNYKKLMALKDDASKHFQKYLPTSVKKVSDNEYTYTLPNRAIPISALGTQKQEHVNWMLSRMLEFAGWINQIGYSHAGITPDSVYIVPENHGMVCTSFYHMAKLGSKLKTVSGKYSQFYPAKVFDTKEATSNIDLDLAKRTAIYLMGDKSGSGVVLRKTHNVEILDFLHKQDFHALECYNEYRALLKKHFDTKKFHELTV